MKIYCQGNWKIGVCDSYFPNKITECYQHNASHRFYAGTLNVSEYLLWASASNFSARNSCGIE